MEFWTTRFILGITGIIGGGKSSAAKFFEEFGAFRISSDELARVYTSSSSPIKNKLVELLGNEILSSSGEIDRGKIAELVFFDSAKLNSLNALIHPLVRKDFHQLTGEIGGGRLIAWEIPLLFETAADKICDATLTVFTDENTAYERAKDRDKITKSQFFARLSKQMSIKDKLALSDFNIENDKTTDDLRTKCREIYDKIMSYRKEPGK
ncbi:MAG: dephospho-CoA kinase [Leptospira sp.]|nr:dephospho-CoA kinase [Leptospira sp.]